MTSWKVTRVRWSPDDLPHNSFLQEVLIVGLPAV